MVGVAMNMDFDLEWVLERERQILEEASRALEEAGFEEELYDGDEEHDVQEEVNVEQEQTMHYSSGPGASGKFSRSVPSSARLGADGSI